MAEQTIFDKIREWIGSVAWTIFLWSAQMTEDEYFAEMDRGRFTGGAGEQLEQLIAAARGLIEYRQQAGPLNFQLEKADTFIFRMRVALEIVGMLQAPSKPETKRRSK
jgi:hypothetical protein